MRVLPRIVLATPVVVCLLAVPMAAGAQTPIGCGQTLAGNIIAPGQQDSYTFSGNTGEAVIVAAVATSGTLAARAELYRPDATLVGTNGFGNAGTGSLVLPSTGTYTIVVRDFDLTKTGTYNVNLIFTTGRCGTTIACGQTLSGTVTGRAQEDGFTFSGNTGEAVIVSAVTTSGTLAARAELYRPDGTLVGTNGFGNTGTGSLVLPSTGTYTIVVRDFSLSETGAYHVDLLFTTGRCGRFITGGQTVGGTIASITQADAFLFCGVAGSSVIVSAIATSGTLAARAEVYRPNGTLIGTNGFGNGSTGTLGLTSTGTYTIAVRDFDLTKTGTYNINAAFVGSICTLPAPAITTQPVNQLIASGQSGILSVVGSGSGLTYQWYQGPSGNTTSPIGGATLASVTTPALISNTRYWVRVSNGSGAADSSTATVTVAFADGALTASSTVIKAVHITELRARIDAVRGRYGLGPYTYANASITPGTSVIMAADIIQMRTALSEAYTQAMMAQPTYSTSPGVGVTVVVADIAELRAALVVIE